MNQPSVNSNLVHLALFFRIAELFPKDDALMGRCSKNYVNDFMRGMRMPYIQPTSEASCRTCVDISIWIEDPETS